MTTRYLVAFLALVTAGLAPPGAAATDPEEARLVATAWAELVVQGRGAWAGSTEPEVAAVHPLKSGGRLVGYVAEVRPDGWVVVPLLRELAPVKAYSESGRFDPSRPEGLPALVRQSLHQTLRAIDEQLAAFGGAAKARIADVVELDHSSDWSALLRGDMAWERSSKAAAAAGVIPGGNYQPGEILLETAWAQGYPYNHFVPGYDDGLTSCDHQKVGCVAVVGAQIMRYWNWPESGTGPLNYTDTYDWANMPPSIDTSSPQAQIWAVAELSYEVGTAANLLYGCDSTSGEVWAWYYRDLEDALTENFRYDDDSTARKDRTDMTASDWWSTIKAQLDANMPIAYAFEISTFSGHAIVIDGWQEIGTTPLRQYHVNYGWGGGASSYPDWAGYDSTNTWITLDGLPMSNGDGEFLVENIKPDLALTYAGLWFFTANQFDDGYVGSDLYLHPYPDLYSLPEIEFVGETQFLPGMTVTCRYEPGEAEGPVRFTGTPTRPGSILSRRGVGANVRLHDGSIVLQDRGRIKVY